MIDSTEVQYFYLVYLVFMSQTVGIGVIIMLRELFLLIL